MKDKGLAQRLPCQSVSTYIRGPLSLLKDLLLLEGIPTPPITSLLRTILRRPEVATYIRKVELMGRSFSEPRFRSKVPKIPISDFYLEEPLAYVAKKTVSYRDAWMDELRNGTMDAFVAILLSQPLSLAHLYIDSDFFIESRFINLIFRSMLFGPHGCGL
ncbi:hypothetical protein DPV78_003770 [Talaromyces pinophilus]|nr:hypothetical protein DPV78_003770 [Talaromyces pinophilus]